MAFLSTIDPMKFDLILVAVCASAVLACSSQQFASVSLKGMKAENYFESREQVELAQAIGRNDIRGIDAAVAKGANVNGIGREEMTPLAWAFSKQKKESFKRLLEKGADPNFKTKKIAWNNDGQSVMQFAALSEDPDYLRWALQHGGNPNGPDLFPGKTIIFTAIRNRRPQNVEILAKEGADINRQDKAGFTPIMMAHYDTQYDLVFLLMKLGADLSKRHHLMTPDGDKKNAGKTLAESIQQFGDRSIRVLGKEKEQREWYDKVVAELKRRGLM